jgi:hypothetical protein
MTAFLSAAIILVLCLPMCAVLCGFTPPED